MDVQYNVGFSTELNEIFQKLPHTQGKESKLTS